MANIDDVNADRLIMQKHFRKHYKALMRRVFNRPELAESNTWMGSFDMTWLSCPSDGLNYYHLSEFMTHLLLTQGVDVRTENKDTPVHNFIYSCIFPDEDRFVSEIMTDEIWSKMLESKLVNYFRLLSMNFNITNIFFQSLVETRDRFIPDDADNDALMRFELSVVSDYYRSYSIYSTVMLLKFLDDPANLDLLCAMGEEDALFTSQLKEFMDYRLKFNPYFQSIYNAPVVSNMPLMIYFSLVHCDAEKNWEIIKLCNSTQDPEGGDLDNFLVALDHKGEETDLDPDEKDDRIRNFDDIFARHFEDGAEEANLKAQKFISNYKKLIDGASQPRGGGGSDGKSDSLDYYVDGESDPVGELEFVHLLLSLSVGEYLSRLEARMDD